MPFLDYAIDFLALDSILRYRLADCVTFNENIFRERLEQNPCLAYYDEFGENCALCKFGSARIFVTLNIDGDEVKKVLCGEVRTRDRNAKGAYEYLDPKAVTQDEISEHKYECFISPYYESVLAKAVLDQATSLQYYPRWYKNVTDGINEHLCVPLQPLVQSKFCKHTTIAPSKA